MISRQAKRELSGALRDESMNQQAKGAKTIKIDGSMDGSIDGWMDPLGCPEHKRATKAGSRVEFLTQNYGRVDALFLIFPGKQTQTQPDRSSLDNRY